MEWIWAEDEQTEWKSYWKEERNRRARENYQRRKEALKEPIEMPEVSEELSEYEKIREMNIKERNDALAAARYMWQPSCS